MIFCVSIYIKILCVRVSCAEDQQESMLCACVCLPSLFVLILQFVFLFNFLFFVVVVLFGVSTAC